MHAFVRTLLAFVLVALLPACGLDGGLAVEARLTGTALRLPEGQQAVLGVRVVRLSPASTARTLTLAVEGKLPEGITVQPRTATLEAAQLAQATESVVRFTFVAAPGVVLAEPLSLSVSLSADGAPVEGFAAGANQFTLSSLALPQFRLTLPVPEAFVLADMGGELPVAVERAAGFSGPVTLEVVGLPEGVWAEPLTLAPEASEGVMVLHAGRVPGSLFPRAATVVAVDERGAEARAGFGCFIVALTGTRDDSFGGGLGMVLLDSDPEGNGDEESVVTLLPQGEAGTVVVAQRDGDLVVTRLLPDGTPDEAFAGGALFFHSGALHPVAASLDEAGRVVVLGVDGLERAVLLRLTANGAVDTRFGVGGQVALALGALPSALLVMSDGGFTVGAGGEKGWVVARLDAGGALVGGFGEAGLVALPGVGAPLALLEAPGPGMLLVGGVRGSASSAYVTVAAFGEDGAPSEMLMPGGLFQAPGMADSLTLHLNPDGTLLLGGAMMDRQGAPVGAMRAVFGMLDRSFGTGGMFGEGGRLFLGEGALAMARRMSVLADGSFVLAGMSPARPGDVVLARYDASGNADTLFGPGGASAKLFGDQGAQADSLVLLPSGQLMVGASVESPMALERDLAFAVVYP